MAVLYLWVLLVGGGEGLLLSCFVRWGWQVLVPQPQVPPVDQGGTRVVWFTWLTNFCMFCWSAGLVAGIRGVEWDAVELPSQYMENWQVFYY